MRFLNREQLIRLSLTLGILLCGMAMVPFVDLEAAPISWERLAGVYEPELEVNESSGTPGSLFAFTGSNYPPGSEAAVYVNGEFFGTVMVDGSGQATFLINSAGANLGQYNVTLEVDINASATQSIELTADGQLVVPPSGFNGPVFDLGNVLYLPIIQQP
ncbi:MAG: hypothetical protein R3E31_04840 [Chloroflexota bacterium]